MLIPKLAEIQRRHGLLPDWELERLAEELGIKKARVWDVASAFPIFRCESGPEVKIGVCTDAVTIGVCRDMACHLRDSADLLGRLKLLKWDQEVEVEALSCLGRCDHAPVARVAQKAPGSGHPRYLGRRSNNDTIETQINAIRSCLRVGPEHPDAPPVGPESELVAKRAGHGAPEPVVSQPGAAKPEPWTMDPYDPANLPKGEVAPAPFAALRAWLGRAPEELIDALKDAELAGLGGALGRTGKKWKDVFACSEVPKYVVANGDESEPGTFKDREVLLRKAHLVVEGVALAGLVLRASRGFIYIRHEYEEQAEAIDRAIARAKAAVPEAFASFELETFISPGGYICGEQHALLEVIEGRRAQPRDPFPALQTNGLYGRPTLLNNVETFAWVPGIALRGPTWYSTLKRRLFSISGDVETPGVFEVPVETTLGALICCAGGMRGRRELKAVAPSGPSGGFLPRFLPTADLRRAIEASLPGTRKRIPSDAARLERFLNEGLRFDCIDVREIPLDGAIWRAIGGMLGAGIVIYAEGAAMAEQAANCLEFFRKESCGKCAPCRIGTQKLVRIAGILRGKPSEPADQALIDRRIDPDGVREAVGELAGAMSAASICSLGQVAPNPLTSAMDHFSDEFPALAHAAQPGCHRRPEADR